MKAVKFHLRFRNLRPGQPSREVRAFFEHIWVQSPFRFSVKAFGFNKTSTKQRINLFDKWSGKDLSFHPCQFVVVPLVNWSMFFLVTASEWEDKLHRSLQSEMASFSNRKKLHPAPVPIVARPFEFNEHHLMTGMTLFRRLG